MKKILITTVLLTLPLAGFGASPNANSQTMSPPGDAAKTYPDSTPHAPIEPLGGNSTTKTNRDAAEMTGATGVMGTNRATSTSGNNGNMATVPSATLQDPEIAQILMAINKGEIDGAQIADSKLQNQNVKTYAKKMISEHKKNSRTTEDLVDKANFDSKEGETAKALKNEMKSSNDSLKSTDKAGMDKAYLAQQVMMHEKALKTIEDSLLPNVQDANLRAHLEATRTHVKGHLDEARSLQTSVR
jgi:putative membrane protein